MTTAMAMATATTMTTTTTTRRRVRVRTAVLLVLLLAAAIVALYGSWRAPAADLVMDGWVTREIGHGVTCQVPESLQPQAVQGFDSRVSAFAGAEMRIDFDFGWYSNSLKSVGGAGYSSRTVTIGGKRARLVRWDGGSRDADRPYVAGVAFRNVSGSGKARNHLTGTSTSATPAGREIAEQVFRTIRFDTAAMAQ